MAVTPTALIESAYVPNAQTTLYTSDTGVTAAIDAATVTNVSGSNATVSINLVESGSSAGVSNLIVDTKTLIPNESYSLPEIVGQILNTGDFISAIAGTASAIVIRVSGREITS